MARPVVAWIVATLLVALTCSNAHATWSRTGNPVSVSPGAQHDPIAISPWIVWTDERHGHAQLYASRVDWYTGLPYPAVNETRVAASDFPQSQVAVDTDGNQWLYLAWSEDRGTGTGRDIYMTRVLHTGLDPDWSSDGVLICGAPGDQTNPRLAAEPPHHLVTWEDRRDGAADIYGLDVGEDGTAMPGWPADGRPIVTDPGEDENEAAYWFWVSEYPDRNHYTQVWSNAGRIRAQAFEVDGTVFTGTNWPPEGVQLSDPAYAASGLEALTLEVYPQNRLLFAWFEDREGVLELRTQGMRVSGVNYWCGGPLFGPAGIAAVPDTAARPSAFWLRRQSNNAYILFQDTRADAGDLYYQGLSLPAAGWFCDPFGFRADQAASGLVLPGTQGPVTRDGPACWVDNRSGVPQIYVFDYYSPTGVGVAPTGAEQSQPSSSFWTGIVFDWTPSPVVAWTDMRNPATAPDIYAQVIGPGGPGAVGVPERTPLSTALSPARPTPSREGVAFTLTIARAADVRLDVVDLAGRRLREIERGPIPAGEREVRWDGRDASGASVGPGLYWLSGTVDGVPISRRIVLVSP